MDDNLDIVFLGGLFPPGKEDEISEISNGAPQSAANALQWNIVDGLDKLHNKTLKIINSLYIGSFPLKCKKLFVRTYLFNHFNESNDVNVGFINLLGIKHLSRYFSLKPYLKRWARQNSEGKVIFGYAMTAVFVVCLKYIKKINPKIKTCLIVPDLPQHMNTSDKNPFLYKIFKNAEVGIIYRNLKYIDYYVLLTEDMKDILNIKNNYLVMEGISTDSFEKINSDIIEVKDDIKKILYTGTLNKKYGVVNLVKAFKRIEGHDYRLILCGSGDSENYILQEAQKDNRIQFMGQLKREEILKYQAQATVLVNPRQNNEVFTKYSFPSKVLEYLSSGTPVIAYKLDGMSDEYEKYIFYVEEDSIKALSEKLVEVCNMNRIALEAHCITAREFVLNNKNSKVQVERIIKMVIDI